jgi:lipopolysaccharide assembly outer membrane protein LptD (OstA)
MRRLPAIVALVFLCALFPFAAPAQQQSSWVVQALSQIIPGAPAGSVDVVGDMAYGTNVFVQYNTNVILIADSAKLDYQSGEAVADGHVRIEEGDLIWTGEHIRYNFITHQMQSEQFRTGKPPVFAQGRQLQGDTTNKTYTARHAFVTTDDVSDPAVRVRASRIKIVPGKYVEMWNAVLFMDGVPTFYFPYYRRNLGPRANNYNFLPGYRSAYGPFLLNTYTWYLNDAVDGKIHLDYREKPGVGAGPDLNLHLGQWGEAEFKYYYLHDRNPDNSTNGTPWTNGIPENRQRFYLGYQATPATNLNLKALEN